MQQVKEINIEEALRQSETKFKHLTALMPMGIISTDKNGLITFYNEKAVEIWGRRPRLNDPTEVPFCGSCKMYDVIGNLLPHEESPMSRALHKKTKFVNEEIIIETPDGIRKNVLVNIEPLYSKDGETEGAINVFKDITADKSKHEDAYKLAAIVDSSEDAIISKTLKGIITSWNKGAERIFGYTEEEIIGKHITTIIPPKHRDEENLIIGKVLKGEKIEHFETIRLTKDGREINISLTVSPVRNDKGEIIGASKVARNITDKIKLDQEIRSFNEDRNRLAAIVESSDDAIVSKNLNGIITSWNKGAERIFGYTAEEIIGKHITTLIPPLLQDEETTIISRIRKGEKVDHFDTIRLAKDGRLINVSITVSPIRNEKGEITGASKVARDITERVNLDNQLRLYNERLKEMNTYKDEFMAMASHELKTPLTVIKANLQILELKLKETPNSEFVSKTMKQVNKLSDLISDLLDVSKIQSGNLQLVITDFDLNKLLKETIENIQQTSPSHKILFEEFDGESMINADRVRIEQVIINVLTNAIKYSPQSNEIKVVVKKQSDQIIVSVQDFGIGIPKQDINEIFSRFYRVRGLASTFSGSGIGLYISNEIIKRHEGKMWVESEEKKGSTFYFSLPASH